MGGGAKLRYMTPHLSAECQNVKKKLKPLDIKGFVAVCFSATFQRLFGE